MSVPAVFRRVLEEQDPDWHKKGDSPNVIVVYGAHLDNYLECYSVETMAEVEGMLDDMDDADPRKDMMTDMFLTHSAELSVDDTGRIALSAKLRDWLGIALGEAAYLRGTGKTFQIWKLATYEEIHGPVAKGAQKPDFNPKAIFDELRKARSAQQEG